MKGNIMSLVTNNRNIIQVGSVTSNSRSINLSQAFADIGRSLSNATSKTVQELFGGDVQLTSKKFECSNKGLLKSTPVCRKEFSDLFESELENASTEQVALISELKGSFLRSVANSNYRITDIRPLQESMTKIVQAENVKVLKQQAKEVLTVIEKQHAELVTNELVTIISEAARELGFSSINVAKDTANTVVIVAENKNGQAIVNEITTAKNLSIDHSFETVGMVDGKCKLISEEFQEKLAVKGFKADNKDSKATLGVPVLNNSKTIFKRFTERKQNKNRARTLNQTSLRLRN